MATADDYAAWIVKNADKRGTPEFDTVAAAYKEAKGAAPAAAPAPAAPAASKDLAFGDAPLVMGVSPNGARAALAGVGKGAGQVALGAQDLLGRGIGALGGKTLGDWLRTDAAAGQKKLEGELAPYKESNPVAAGTGELVGQGVATLPVGGALAAPIKLAARAAPVLAPIADAVATGGFRAAGARGVGGMAARMAGGAATGGATMELIDPEHAGTGALIGAALPPAMRVAGAVARPVGNAIARAAQPAEMSAADDIARALDASTPEQLSDLVAKLRSGEKLVTTPTAAQAIQSPAASILQRVVHDTPGGAALRNKIASQAEERLNALESVAATNPTGYAEARDDLGNAIARRVIPEERAISDRISQQYAGIDPNRTAQIPLPVADMQGAVDRYLGAGSFGKNQDAALAVRTAEELSTPTRATRAPLGAGPARAPAARAASWDEVNKLRNSLGEAWSRATENGDRQAAAALDAQRRALDEAINRHLPPDQLSAWLEANASHAAKMDRFHTGPQAAIFQTRNGAPAVQGGEVAQKFWSASPGAADDVRAFQRLVDNNPSMLGQFKSLIATHGASTADAAGNLTTKFSKWVEQTLPGLREAFSPAEVETLQRIAKDIDRAAVANKLGTSLGGSNTYQNAANALDLGLLDSPALTKAASMVPGVRMIAGPALEGLRSAARNTKATRMAELLADSDVSANALEKLLRARSPKSNALAQAASASVYRSAPRNGSGSP